MLCEINQIHKGKMVWLQLQKTCRYFNHIFFPGWDFADCGTAPRSKSLTTSRNWHSKLLLMSVPFKDKPPNPQLLLKSPPTLQIPVHLPHHLRARLTCHYRPENPKETVSQIESWNEANKTLVKNQRHINRIWTLLKAWNVPYQCKQLTGGEWNKRRIHPPMDK